MVELGNHQGRPPGVQPPLSEMTSDLSPVSLSSSLLDHWINQDISSLDFLDSLCTLNEGQTNDPGCGDTASGYINAKESVSAASVIGLQEAEKLYMYQPTETYQRSSCLPLWGFPMDVDSLKLDDVFQVDQSDLVLSPTLAELNADKEPFFDLEFSDLHFDMASEIKKDIAAVKEIVAREETPKAAAAEKPSRNNIVLKTEPGVLKTEHEIKKEVVDVASFADNGENVASMTRGKVSCSSPLAIPSVSVRSRQRTYSSTELSVTSSVSSNDEGFGSQAEDTDVETHLASDNESLICDDESLEGNVSSPGGTHWFSATSSKPGSRKKRYFWQYNIQSKGPKGPRMTMNNTSYCLDPHVLSDATDPVFSSDCHLEGVKHAGKARRGDGNDLTPNPRKLHSIGVELKALSKMIHDLSPACDVPGNAKPKSRKEKNKLASRSCRLKKKAQHEANKLKLFGLQQEHTQLLNFVGEVKGLLLDMKHKGATSKLYQQNLQKMLDKRSLRPVAGHTAEYVNSILDKVAAGQPLPGLDDIQS